MKEEKSTINDCLAMCKTAACKNVCSVLINIPGVTTDRLFLGMVAIAAVVAIGIAIKRMQ